MLYNNGGTPPVELAVILPFALLQDAVTVVAVNVGPAELAMVALAVVKQPLAS